MGRIARAALKSVCGLIAEGGEAFSETMKHCLTRWENGLPTGAPRSILTSERNNSPIPVGIYSDATGGGEIARLSSLPIQVEPSPIPLRAQANRMPQDMAATPDELFIFPSFLR